MSASTSQVGRGRPSVRGVARYQWMVFLVAWLGWLLDAIDFGLFNLVPRPALTKLLGSNPPHRSIGEAGGYLGMAGLLGRAAAYQLKG
jgi:hypothetical protein